MRTSTRLLLVALLASLAPLSASAQTASPPAGYITFTLPATTAAATSYLSAPLLTTAVFSGVPSAVTASTLTVATASWTAGGFAGATPHYVFVKSGGQAGRSLRILANTETTLTLDLSDDSAQSTDLTLTGFALSTTDTFEICPGYTLGSFFGATTATQVLTGASSAAAADTVGLWNWRLNRFETYYFNTTQGAWLRTDGTTASATATVLPPQTTLAIMRLSGRGAVDLIQQGRVPTVAPLLKNPGLTTRYAGLRLPVDLKLSQVVLGSGWVKSDSPFAADALSLYNATTGAWESYYQRADGSWRKIGSTASQDATVVPSGSAVAFTKRAAATGSASFQAVTLPYVP